MTPSYLSNIIEWPRAWYWYGMPDRGFSNARLTPGQSRALYRWPELLTSLATLGVN